MHSGTLCRRVVVWLLVLGLAQFAYFTADYFTAYRMRSNVWFEGNREGAFDIVLERDRREPIGAVYLSESVPWIEERWRLFLIAHHREDLLARTRPFQLKALRLATLSAV